MYGTQCNFASVSLTSNLFVSQLSTLSNDVKVYGTQSNFASVSLTSNLFVSQLSTLSNDVKVYGTQSNFASVSLTSNLFVSQLSTLSNDVKVYGTQCNFASVSLTSNLFVSQLSTLSNDVKVYGTQSNFASVSLTSNLFVSKDVKIYGTQCNFANVSLASNLFVAQQTTLSNDVKIYGIQYNYANVNIASNLIVSQRTTLSNDVTIYGNQLNYATATFQSNLIVNNNIGIGKSAPSAPLDVYGNANVQGLISSYGIALFKDTSGITASNIDINSNSVQYDGTGSIFRVPTNTVNSSFRFYGSNTEIIRLTGNGMLGIGTASPLASLHVNGTSLFSGQAIVLSNQTNPFLLVQNTIGTSLMGIASTASVFSTDAAAGDFIIKSFTNNKVILQTGNAGAAVSVNTNNYVGIGTGNAVYPLDVGVTTRFGLLAGTGNRSLYVDPSGVLTISVSDSNMKQNIQPIEYGLCNILLLNPISFNWNSNIQYKFGPQREIGLIAQEVKEIIPEIVGRNIDGIYSLDYSRLVPVLIKAITELNERITYLENKNT